MRVAGDDCRPATAAVELAILLPFLLYMSAITTDWARIMHFTITVEACARNGAIYASDTEVARQSPYGSVSEAALAEAPNLSATASVTSAAATDAAGNPAVVVTVTAPFNTVTTFPGVPGSQTITRSVQMRVAPIATK